MALYLVFPSLAGAQSFSSSAAKSLGCDATTQFWWPVVQDQGSAQAAVVISDQPGAFGQNMLPPAYMASLKTTAQLATSGWVWAKDPSGNQLIPALSLAAPIPIEAQSGSPITTIAVAPLA